MRPALSRPSWMTSEDHQVVGDDLQELLVAAGPRSAGAKAVAEVAFDHAVDRLGLRPLAVGPAGLRASQTPAHQPPVTADRGLWAGASGAGGDQRADGQVVSGDGVVGLRIEARVSQDELQTPAR